MSTFLGQNFLNDQKVISYIAKNIEKLLNRNKNILLEIGPGKGAITKKIMHLTSDFFVIETDIQMVEKIKDFLPKEQIIHKDVLKFNINNLLGLYPESGSEFFVVGNLPYYITSPILRKFFGSGKQDFTGGFFMIQAEVGEKIASEAKKKSYLWWLLNRGYEIKYLKTIGPKSFSPPPKVKSCLISIKKKEKEGVDFGILGTFLDQTSKYSRKTLGKIEKMELKKGIRKFQIPEELKKKRLEELEWNDLATIFKKYA